MTKAEKEVEQVYCWLSCAGFGEVQLGGYSSFSGSPREDFDEVRSEMQKGSRRRDQPVHDKKKKLFVVSGRLGYGHEASGTDKN